MRSKEGTCTSVPYRARTEKLYAFTNDVVRTLCIVKVKAGVESARCVGSALGDYLQFYEHQDLEIHVKESGYKSVDIWLFNTLKSSWYISI